MKQPTPRTRLMCLALVSIVSVAAIQACAKADPLAEDASRVLQTFVGAVAERDAKGALDSIDERTRKDLTSLAAGTKRLRARASSLSDERDREAALAWLSAARVPEAQDPAALLQEILSRREPIALADAASSGLRVSELQETQEGVLEVSTSAGSQWTLVREGDSLRVQLETQEQRSLRTAKERLGRLGERFDVWILERQRLRAGWAK